MLAGAGECPRAGLLENQALLLNLLVNSGSFLCVTLQIFSVKTKVAAHQTKSSTSWAFKSTCKHLDKEADVSVLQVLLFLQDALGHIFHGSAIYGCEFGDRNLSLGHFISLITGTYFCLFWFRLLIVQYFCSHPQKNTGYNNVQAFLSQNQRVK